MRTNRSEDVIDIQFQDESEKAHIDVDVVQKKFERILDALSVKEAVEFSLTFVDDIEMHHMNKQYRDIDRTTDILTFALEDEGTFPSFPAGGKRVLGDVVISLGSMRENAKAFGVSEDEELFRLLIHGVLHLLGENHETNDVEKEPMLQKQESLLIQLGGKSK